MSKAKHESAPVQRYVTPMTREGVTDPSLLSPEGQLQHAKRLGGPGTRSKNPARYDRNAEMHRIDNEMKRENRAKALNQLKKVDRVKFLSQLASQKKSAKK